MDLDTFVFSAVLLLGATSIMVAVFKHLGLGSVLGLLTAGAVLGPYSPGVYLTQHVEDIRHFTELGVVLLLFLIGLEMKPDRLWSMRREVFGLGSLQILLTGLVIAAYASLFQPSWQGALLIGLTLALSSTAFVLQLLQERGEVASPHGRSAFAVLLMQDLAVVPLLALVPMLSDVGSLSSVPVWEQLLVVTGMLLLLWVFGRHVLPFALDRLAMQGNREGFALSVMLAVFLAAWSMHKAGLSMALGAFMMGMLLSGSRYNLQIQAIIEPYKGLLMSLFFVAVGMSIDFRVIVETPWLYLQHTVVIVVIKLVVLFLLALAFRLPRSAATRMSFLMAQGGEFGFVIFGAAKGLDVIDDRTFVTLIGVISISMLITPLLLRAGNALARRAERAEQEDGDLVYQADGGEMPAIVVLAGYGRVGHAVATLLYSSGVPLMIFDNDPEQVRQAKNDGFNAYFGDISDPVLLETANLSRASLLVLTIDDEKTTLRTVRFVRGHYPNLPIIARARDLKSCGELLQAGVTDAFPETLESSMRLGANALRIIGVPTDNVDMLLRDVRSENYDLVRHPEDKPG